MSCFLIAIALIFTLSTAPALAAENKEWVFREDSGLTKTEYFLSIGQFSASLNIIDDVIKRHPNNADAYTYRGYAYYKLGDAANAVKSFRTALQINPTHLGANKYLASLYLDAGETSRALEQLQVIRMVCGRTDCEELNALEREIDQYKKGERQNAKAPDQPPAATD